MFDHYLKMIILAVVAVDSQSSSVDVVHVFMSSFSETTDTKITASVTRASVTVASLPFSHSYRNYRVI